MSQIFRQGDILLREVSDVDAERLHQVSKEDGIVLAYGEVTGHSHRVQGEAVLAADYDMTKEQAHQFALNGEKSGRLFLLLDDSVSVAHEEHGTIPIEGKGSAGKPRVFEVIRQREFDKTEGMRFVAD